MSFVSVLEQSPKEGQHAHNYQYLEWKTTKRSVVAIAVALLMLLMFRPVNLRIGGFHVLSALAEEDGINDRSSTFPPLMASYFDTNGNARSPSDAVVLIQRGIGASHNRPYEVLDGIDKDPNEKDLCISVSMSNREEREIGDHSMFSQSRRD